MTIFFGGEEFTLPLTTNVAQPDIPALAAAAGWNGASRLVVNITAPLVNTLNIPANWNFPGGIRINVSAATRIGGVRGNGFPPKSGGAAMVIRQPVTIDNLGIISGGGGQGGQGPTSEIGYYGGNAFGPAYGGAGGTGQGFTNASSLSIVAAQPGDYGGVVCYSGEVIGEAPCVYGGQGGNGGGWGMAGQNVGGPYVAGLAGAYVDGASYVTWINTGTRLGRSL